MTRSGDPFTDPTRECIVLRSADMRDVAYEDQHESALAILAAHWASVRRLDWEEDCDRLGCELSDLRAMREEAEAQGGEAWEDVRDDYSHGMSDLWYGIESLMPEGWWYGANEHDPAEGGFYRLPADEWRY